jgi:hypothetical protein
MKRLKHLLKEWECGFPKTECGKLVEEEDATLVLEHVTCGTCIRSKGFKKLRQSRPFRWAQRR